MEAPARSSPEPSTAVSAVPSPSADSEHRKRPRCTSEALSDHTLTLPSPKKPRTTLDSTDSNGWELVMAQASTTERKRDPEYYFEDGSCIFLVENTLFNVHRTRLSNDSTTSFGSMFSLPQGDLDVEGKSDDNPIVLTGDTPAEFRNFLWSFYALPPEISKASENLRLMIDVARVSNKYGFKNLETWSLNTVHEYVNRKPSPILATVPPAHTYTFSSDSMTTRTMTTDTTIQSTEELTKLIRLAQLCNHEPLLTTMISHLKQLMTSSVQYAYLAMTLADELDIRSLRGVAYLEVMHKAVVVRNTKTDIDLKAMMTPQTPSTAVNSSMLVTPGVAILAEAVSAPKEGAVDKDGRLVINRTQQLRLLTGFYRLTGTWERLRMTPPAFDHASSCGATWHQHGCTQSWAEFWKEKTRIDAVLALGLADVVGRLKQVHKEYERWGSAPYMHHDCRSAARKAIVEVIKKIEDGLSDFFSESGEGE
ncbi:hypothetical protein DXG01_004045 [Tephrocybe rancida]|nr:hypothetical protein DXG01_004045 [Tephrocybe rancida]